MKIIKHFFDGVIVGGVGVSFWLSPCEDRDGCEGCAGDGVCSRLNSRGDCVVTVAVVIFCVGCVGFLRVELDVSMNPVVWPWCFILVSHGASWKFVSGGTCGGRSMLSICFPSILVASYFPCGWNIWFCSFGH